MTERDLPGVAQMGSAGLLTCIPYSTLHLGRLVSLWYNMHSLLSSPLVYLLPATAGRKRGNR